jgi:hypothetical protein
MEPKTTSEKLAAIRSGHNPPLPAQMPTHGTGASDDVWSVRRTKSITNYEREVSATDPREIQIALTEFWRKLAIEIGASCAGKSWNVLAVDATLDYGSIGGTAFNFTDRNSKTIDIRNMPCHVNITLFIPYWEQQWYRLDESEPNDTEWEQSAAKLESIVYDQIEFAVHQEPARSALIELRKTSQFDIWVQPHDSPESGRFIEIQVA